MYVVDPVSQLRVYPKSAVLDKEFPGDFMYDVHSSKVVENLERKNLVQVPVEFKKRSKGHSSLGGFFSASIRVLTRLNYELANSKLHPGQSIEGSNNNCNGTQLQHDDRQA